MAAEIVRGSAQGFLAGRSFNEAAANGRGNLTLGGNVADHAGASMRPRRMAAEISSIGWRPFAPS